MPNENNNERQASAEPPPLEGRPLPVEPLTTLPGAPVSLSAPSAPEAESSDPLEAIRSNETFQEFAKNNPEAAAIVLDKLIQKMDEDPEFAEQARSLIEKHPEMLDTAFNGLDAAKKKPGESQEQFQHTKRYAELSVRVILHRRKT